jgi:hypothetical protein
VTSAITIFVGMGVGDNLAAPAVPVGQGDRYCLPVIQ